MRRFILVDAAFILFVLFFMSGCGEKVKPGSAAPKRERVTGIAVRRVTLSMVNEGYETSGTVAARTESVVASRTMGTVTSVRVKEGDRVAAGQLLLTLDDRDALQRVRAAREGYNEAQKGLEAARENKILADTTYGRYKALYDERALSRQELDQMSAQMRIADIDFQRAGAAVERARAGLDEANIHRGFAGIVAPVRGVVTNKKIDVGSMAVPGAPLLTVQDDSEYRVEVSGDEGLAGKIRPGMPASVSIPAIRAEIQGRITEVVPSIDPLSRSFMVKIALRGAGLRNGFYAKVSIPIGTRNALLVPRNAIVERGQLTGVFTVGRDSVILYRLVKTGRAYGEAVEVLSGLNPGDEIVIGGTERAVDGGLAVLQK